MKLSNLLTEVSDDVMNVSNRVMSADLIIAGTTSCQIVGILVPRKSGFTPYIVLIDRSEFGPTGFAPHGRVFEEPTQLWKGKVATDRITAVDQLKAAMKSIKIQLQ